MRVDSGLKSDVVVIGAGLNGSAIAYGLVRRGLKVLLLDGDDRDLRASSANMGLVWEQGKGLDMPAYQQLTRSSGDLWPAFSRELEDESSIQLEYERNGGLTLCLGERDYDDRRAKLMRLHNQLGGQQPDWEMLDRGEVQRLLPDVVLGRDVVGASFGRRDGHTNPLMLLAALHAGITRLGVVLRAGARVRTVSKDGGSFTLDLGSDRISADRIVIAAGLGSKELAAQIGIHLPIRPQRGQILVAMRKATRRRARREVAGEDRQPENRANLYDEVTARIVAELEAGRFPWVQPWGKTGGTGPGLPRNALTARSYSGVNILILWGAVIEHGWPSQSWLTFRQAQEAGGCVRKGEHGVTVVYADRFTPEAEKERAQRDGDEARAVPFLKRFTVFNVAQCEGLRAGLASDPAPLPEREIVPVAEEVIAASGVDFRIGGTKAFYAPEPDFVQVPPQPAFFDQINYYRTCLHELTHATGHPKRLGRDLKNAFGSKDYAREELVAEMGSAFLCAALGIVPTVRHADYIGSWLEVLREDNRAIFRAASAATKAADWLLARHREAQEARIEGRIAA